MHLMINHQSNTIVVVYAYPSTLCEHYFCKPVTMKSWTGHFVLEFALKPT
jgi:hypothetical protein